MNNKHCHIPVIKSSMPAFDDYCDTIRLLWENRTLTNMGILHKKFEEQLVQYLSAGESKNDSFGHAILGGAGQAVKNLILDHQAASRVKVQDLSTAQRCAIYCQSLTDVSESFNLGMSAHMHSMDRSFSGKMVGLRRKEQTAYDVEYITVPAKEIANHVKNFPQEWMLADMAGISDEALAYIKPLIIGEPDLLYKDGMPAYLKPFYCK